MSELTDTATAPALDISALTDNGDSMLEKPHTTNQTQAAPAPNFTFSPTLAPFTFPLSIYLTQTFPPPATKTYTLIATSCHIITTPTPTSPPRILLLRRAPSDSMPLRWEPPGGAVDPEDPSILHAAAREVLEESGLTVRNFDAVVRPEGRVFVTSRGKTVGKFEFLVGVRLPERFVEANDAKSSEGTAGSNDLRSTNGKVWPELPDVKLDPNEHCEFMWATEGEVRSERRDAGSGRDGDAESDFKFTKADQRDVVLSAFHMWKTMHGQ